MAYIAHTTQHPPTVCHAVQPHRFKESSSQHHCQPTAVALTASRRALGGGGQERCSGGGLATGGLPLLVPLRLESAAFEGRRSLDLLAAACSRPRRKELQPVKRSTMASRRQTAKGCPNVAYAIHIVCRPANREAMPKCVHREVQQPYLCARLPSFCCLVCTSIISVM